MIEKFTLGAKEYYVDTLDSIDDFGLGRCFHAIGKITIAKKWQGYKIPEDAMLQNFYHELIHAILIEMGEEEISENERFVQGFATLLHQFETTKRNNSELKSRDYEGIK